MELFRKLDPDGRRAARSAIDRLLATGEATAFAHRGEAGGGRIAHHVRVAGRRRHRRPLRDRSPASGGCRRPRSADRPARRPRRPRLDRRAAGGDRAARRPGRPAALGQPLRRDQRRLRPRHRRCGAAGGGAADRAPCRARTAGAGWWRAWPAPNSRCCSPRRRRSTRAASSPASWSRRSAGRSPRATMSSPWAPRPASPRPQAGDDAAPPCCAAPAPLWPRRATSTARRSGCSRRARRAPPRAATGSRSTCGARSTRTRSRSASSRRSR